MLVYKLATREPSAFPGIFGGDETVKAEGSDEEGSDAGGVIVKIEDDEAVMEDEAEDDDFARYVAGAHRMTSGMSAQSDDDGMETD